MKIWNEVKYAEQLIKQGFIQKKYEYELKILAKYYFREGKRNDELKGLIAQFCKKNISNFNEIKYMRMIKRVCNYPEYNSLFIINPVRITKAEIDKIKTLNDLKVEKVAFVLLVLSNINKQSYTLYMRDRIKYLVNENSRRKKLKEYKEIDFPNISLTYFVNEKINSIFKLAKIYLKKDERNKILRTLIEKEFIVMTKSCKYKINYVHHNTKETAVVINNFDDFVLEYERLIGENIGYCEKCNKPIRIRGKNHKMCSDCWKFHRKEYEKLKKREYRNNMSTF